MTPSLDAKKVAAARLWAVARFPYLATALFASTFVEAPGSETIAVARTWRVHADPVWVDRLSADQLGRLLVHHAGHLLRDHAERADVRGVREDNARARWNRAADAEINDDLAASGLVPEVAPDQPRDLGCDANQLAEAYYTRAADGPRRWDCGSGCDNLARPWDGAAVAGDPGNDIGSEQGQLLRLGVAADIQRRQGSEPGSVPGGWLRWAETVLPSQVDWRRVLAAEIRFGIASIAGRVDYTYRRPSRRARTAPDVVMPSLHRPIPDVAVVCDTSGSMHEQLLSRALAEIEGLLARAGLRQTQVRVLACDTNIHAVRKVSKASQVELAGGGGTDMGAGIAAAAALRPRPSVIIVLTDGYTPWPPQPPRGARVIVGLLTEPWGSAWHNPPPAWARTVQIPSDLQGS